MGDELEGELEVVVDSQTGGRLVASIAERDPRSAKGSQSIVDKVLFEGNWEPGTYTYPLNWTTTQELVSSGAPAGGNPYQLVVEAQTEDDAASVSEGVAFELHPTEPMHSVEVFSRDSGTRNYWLGLLGLAALLLFILGILAPYTTSEGVGVTITILVVLFSLGALMLLYYAMSSYLARIALGHVSVDVHPHHGDGVTAFDIELFFTPRRAVELDKIEAKLQQSYTTTGPDISDDLGQSSRTRIWSTCSACEEISLSPRQDFSTSVRLDVPSETPFSHGEQFSKFKVHVLIDIKGWPDYSSVFYVNVLPYKYAPVPLRW